ncbi:MAG: hypothetical protein M3296_06475 [Actinomycetota bacterium]|nr:hypothetical protein [Actinomycetota bacterium]
MPKRVIAVALAVAVLGWVPSADAAFVSKREARAFLLRAVPPGAPRVLLRDERAGFFRMARLRVQPARRCRRRAAAAVSCGFRARLVPDAAHRRHNWWPISCRGRILVVRRGDGRLQGRQREYVCRTVRP